MTHISTPADTRPHSDRFRCGGRGSNFLLVVILTLSLGLFVFTARAEVKPYALCTDGMVLQQQTEAKLWGTADTGEVVTVTFRGKQASATAGEGGRWVVAIPAGEAGGPFEMTVVGKNTLSYKNVLVGEVWLCSGQSNMDWGLASCDESDKAHADTAPSNPMLRLFTTYKHSDAGATQYDSVGVWSEATPKTIYRFSAVGYFFGRHLQEQRKVPVGLIFAAQGGARIQTYLSPSAVTPFEKPRTDDKAHPVGLPSGCYFRDIQPLLDCRMRGVIWYQGEGNGGDWKYRLMLSALIDGWRNDFQNPDLAFHIVQLPHGPGWDWGRESQTLTAMQGRNTGLAVISEFGGSIHPNPKRPVGDRLALAARGITYGEKIVYSGPMLRTITYDGAKAVLEFNHVGGGLVAKEMWLDPKGDSHPYHGKTGSSTAAYRVKEDATGSAALVGFAIRGPDEKYWPAQADIVGNTVVVTSEKVAAAAGVRYGFHTKDAPYCNLYNREGLPAPVFGTDGVTAPLTLSAGLGGTVAPASLLIVAKGAAIPIRATPAPNHIFTGWTILKGTAELADAKAADTTTVRVFGDAAIRANFALRVACSIAEPANPTVVKAGAKLRLTAKTFILHGDSSIRKVEFFRGDFKIGEAASEPCAYEWSDVPAGSHSVTARATDSTGLTATSLPVCVLATASGSWEGIHAEGGATTYYTEGGKHWTAHTFTEGGKLSVMGDGEIEYLVVGGGGGGGGTYDGGGGGAGGFLTGKLTLAKGEYSIGIGVGGTGYGRGTLSNGGDSFIARVGKDVVRAVGGGHGASSAPPSVPASNGGSGGGGAHGLAKGTGLAGPPQQGQDGGDGGGGGAGGAAPAKASSAAVRKGGLGRASSIRDGVTAVTYASGGGARSRPSYEPLVADGSSKEENTGDGGDGGSSSMYGASYIAAKGGNGGSGIVIIRYVTGGK